MALLLVAACSSTPKEEPASPVQSYTVNGVIRQLPEAPGNELMIEHEAIADFVNAAGDTVGMHAMTMGFPVDEGVDLEGFAPGDSIRFRFEVRWGGTPPLRLVSLQRRS
jgi:Cu/Ag efflux protein CusF